MSRSSRTTPEAAGAIREDLLEVRFPLEARIARGTMTVRQLLELRPGSVLRSGSKPGERILLCSGSVAVAAAQPLVEDEGLLLQIESTGDDGV